MATATAPAPRRVGDMIVKATAIIGTDVVYVEAYEPSSARADLPGSHGTVTHGLDGVEGSRWGKVATRRLPADIEAMPIRDESGQLDPERLALVRRHYDDAAQAAAEAVLAAHPAAWLTPGGWRLK